jgi:hypothetical protein
MRSLWSKRWFLMLIGVIGLLLVLTVLMCWHWGIWSYKDYFVYKEILEYPVGEDLWRGRICANQKLDTFAAEHPPHRMRRLGPFVLMHYYAVWPTPANKIQMESLQVVAKDGRLIHAAAAGCTWSRVFFEMNPEDSSEFEREYKNDFEKRHPGLRRH